MKKILILLLSFLPLITFTACNNEDDIRKDIDDLNARLDVVMNDLASLNTSVKSFQDALKGLILITSYTTDENGDHTFTLSDGTKLIVYGGKPLGEIPSLGINEAGNWTYTLDGGTVELKDSEGNPYPAKPVDGKDGQTPQISISKDGYWYYAIGDGDPIKVAGPYNVADIGKIPGGIFASVSVIGNVITFKFPDGATTDIPLLGGLDLTFSNAPATVAKEKSIKLTAKQTNISNIVIDPTPLQIKMTEDATDNLIITAKGVAAGNYVVHFQIFCKEGYRLIRSLNVTVTE